MGVVTASTERSGIHDPLNKEAHALVLSELLGLLSLRGTLLAPLHLLVWPVARQTLHTTA